MDYSVLKKAIDKIVSLPEDDFAVLSACTTRKQLKRKETLLRQGKVCRSFFFVESGHLRTWYNKDGVRINQHFTFEDEFTSVIKSLRDHQPSHLNLEAGENATVWIINLDALWAQAAERPQLARFFRKVVFRLMLAAEAHSDLLKLHTPAERYGYIQKNSPKLLERIPLTQIASYLGLARETLSRIRARAI